MEMFVSTHNVVGVVLLRESIRRDVQFSRQTFRDDSMVQARSFRGLDHRQIPTDDGHHMAFFQSQQKVFPAMFVH